MAITVKHSKVSTIPDDADTSLVRPSDWNDDHVLTGTVPVANGGTGAATLTGYVKGNGTSAMTAASTIPNTDITGLGTASTKDAGVANGVATLDSSGQVPLSQIPPLGDLVYQGTWNANLNIPVLVSSVGVKGYYYVVNVAGSTNLNGITDWQVGDWAVFNGLVWEKIDNTDSVTSVNGYTGTVVLNYTDVGAFPATSTTGSGNVVLATGATQANPTISNYEDFTPTSAPAYSEGRVWYDSTEKALAFYNDSSALAVHVSQDLIFKVINNTGSTIPNGSPVYITGTSSGQTYPNVALAKADVAATSSVIGLTNGAIANGAIGYVTSQGTIDNVNTSTFTVGQVLYLSPYSAGQIMNTVPPTGITVQVGIATFINSSTGHIYVKQTTPLAVPASIITGQVAVANGGTGAATLTGYVKGSGTSAMTASSTIPTTDLSGTITNAQLSNSAITINGTSTSLGGSISVGTVTGVSGTAPIASSGGNTPAISISQATTSTDGYLSSTDWNTFNGKGNGTVTSVAALTLGTTGTDLSSTVANGTTTPVITLQVPTASATNRGALSSTDWSTFNGKQTALVSGTNIKTVSGTSLLGSGDLGTIGVAYGGTGTSTAFTAGSVVFAGSSGVYTQDNAQLFWDDTNNRLGIGVTPTLAKLHISSSVSGEEGVYVATTGAGGSFTGVSETGPILDGTSGGLTLSNLTSTDGSTSGLNAYYYKVGGSPAAGDSVALLRFFGESSTLASTEYGRITTLITVATNGSQTGELRFGTYSSTAITNSMRLLDSTQAFIPAVYNSTTASAANVFVASNGLLSRSTSSIKYKTQIEDLAEPNSANIYNMRPVWYRSTCATDNKDWSWYGLIAEEVAEIDPRLVHWGYGQDQYDISYIENDGQKEEVKTLKEDAVLQPEGVQYDRLNVLLIQEMKVLKAELESLKAEVSKLLINKFNNPT